MENLWLGIVPRSELVQRLANRLVRRSGQIEEFLVALEEECALMCREMYSSDEGSANLAMEPRQEFREDLSPFVPSEFQSPLRGGALPAPDANDPAVW